MWCVLCRSVVWVIRVLCVHRGLSWGCCGWVGVVLPERVSQCAVVCHVYIACVWCICSVSVYSCVCSTSCVLCMLRIPCRISAHCLSVTLCHCVHRARSLVLPAGMPFTCLPHASSVHASMCAPCESLWIHLEGSDYCP